MSWDDVVCDPDDCFSDPEEDYCMPAETREGMEILLAKLRSMDGNQALAPGTRTEQ